jgi:bifunctional non-homologous end joining protein LigD
MLSTRPVRSVEGRELITPMAARLVKDPFDREDWFFELKWDGFRAIAETDYEGGVKPYSRNHRDFNKRFPLIVEALAALKTQAIFDGEIVALDEGGRPRFEWLVNRGRQKGSLVYYVFDLLDIGGVDLRSEPLRRRKKLLAGILKKHSRVIYLDHMEREGLAM